MFVYFRLIIPNKCSIVKRKFYAFPEKTVLCPFYGALFHISEMKKSLRKWFFFRHSRINIVPRLSVKNLFFAFSELLPGEKNIFVRRREKMF